MPPRKILDTHIHLWPSTAVTPKDHGWMTQGHMLAKGHGISDYISASSIDSTRTSASPASQSSGFVYVETDRYLPNPEPSFTPRHLTTEDERIKATQTLKTWAAEPINELKFLRRIAEDSPEEGDGFTAGTGAAQFMAGCVIWAPFHIPYTWFTLYLKIAQAVAGPALWDKVVGFRYLLQGKGEEEVKRLTEHQDFLGNVLDLRNGRSRTGGRAGAGWAFDVGVDAHRDGVHVVEYVADMVETIRVKERDSPEEGAVTFVLNHLCKPQLSLPTDPWPSLSHYKAALQKLHADENIYMKLSGAFNELEPSPFSATATTTSPKVIEDILESLSPILETVHSTFSGRIMFGSDWPVCNVGGPGDRSWSTWKQVVETWIERGDEDEDNIWWKAGSEAYGIDAGKFGGQDA